MTSVAFMSAKILNLYDITIKNSKKMENKKALPHSFSVKFDSKVIEAASPEEVIEQIKLLQKQHPDAQLAIGGIAFWWTISHP